MGCTVSGGILLRWWLFPGLQITVACDFNIPLGKNTTVEIQRRNLLLFLQVNTPKDLFQVVELICFQKYANYEFPFVSSNCMG